MTIKELYEQKGKIYAELKDLGKQIEEATDEVVVKEKMEQFEKFDKDYETINERIKTIEKANKMEAEQAEVKHEFPKEVNIEEQKKSAFIEYCMNGIESMKPESREVLRGLEVRTNEQSTTAGKGGYTIPTLVMNEIMTAQKYFGGMLDDNYTNWIRTAAGEPITIPLNDDTANSGFLLTEATDAETSAVDTNLTTATLNAYKYSSGLVKVSYELLQDTGYSFFIPWFIDTLTKRLFRGINTAFTTGTGSSQPQGIKGAATKGEDALARGIARTDILNLMHSVDRSYRQPKSCAFMMNDTTLGAIKALAFGSADARPLWQMSMRDGEPDTLEGKPYLINNDIEDIFPTYSSVFFGDWKKFLIRQAGGLRVIRFDELFAAYDQIGFVVLGRYDSELGASDAPIKYIRHPDT